jgi:hypothetical protein
MGYSRYDPAMQGRAAWNAGKAVGTKRPLTQKQIWAIRFFLDRERCLRDRALFDLAIDRKLRGCDLVKIKIGDVVAGADVRTRAIVVHQKTGRPVQFELTSDVRSSLLAWLERRHTEFCRNPEMRSIRLEDPIEPTELGIVRFCRGIRRDRCGNLGGRKVSRSEW